MEILFYTLIKNKVRIDGAFKDQAIYEFSKAKQSSDAVQVCWRILNQMFRQMQR